MMEILCTTLSGAIPNMLESTGAKPYSAAYNSAVFTDVDTFKETMDRMLEHLRNTRPAAGQERVLYPGLSEYEDEQERRAHGIPLHKKVIA